MNSKVKKVLSIIIVILVVFGAYVSVFGIGSVKNIKDELTYGLDINGGVYVVMQANTGTQSGTALTETMDRTKEVLNRRVDSMGVSNANVSVEGNNRLRIEMPGVKDAKTAIDRIGQTAKLRFTLADGTEYLTGDDIKNASAESDSENGGYKVVLDFTSKGQSKFAEATSRSSSGDVSATVTDTDGNTVDKTAIVIWLDNKVISAPTTSSEINNDSCEITYGSGGATKAEATETAALIKGGALPVSLKEVSSSVQTATIGANALNKSIVAGAIGLGLVFILMLLMYNLLGLFADIALTLYIMLVLWIMSAMGAVLTLPGIAGIVLGIGMAVDANVIIFSRIKEEIGLGRSIRVAVDQGFKHALTTVLDAQITTLIATVVMYELGSTTVKGFAVTLMISIVVSIFTAVVITQLFVGALADSKFARNAFFGCKPDGTPKKLVKKEFHFIEKRKIFYCISAVVIIAGLVTLGFKGFNYGIDFTGGTMIQMDLGQKVAISEVEKTIKSYDLNPEIVYSGADKHEVIIKTTKALDAAGRDKVQKTIEEKYSLNDDSVVASEEFGGTIGKEIKNNAVKSIIIAALGMLLYIIFRFRSWKYGVAAIAGILHDVLVMIAVYAIFGITVNNPFIAAILTVVGYSINDTIVIFDRVRENSHLMRGKPTMQILDHSINQTLDRSVMTSMTTLISIVPLLVLVSTQLSQFILPLMVGVATGTYSSIFLCSPLYYEFNKKAEASKYVAQQKAKQRIEAKKAAKAMKLEKPPTEAQIEAQVAAETIDEKPDTVKSEKANKPANNSKKGTGGSKSKNKKKKKKH
ncbi:protein translocase subunit SecD [Aminicella lysinilytica]|uniref:protein translocase subunit SecD n=1 Tax=Aminicella lysinilytica TaxID=433323 RepID=UPI0026E949E5|nr:protein translocase subunit SecD [Aminicella lysinilytica]